jgi:hypothetical protein
MLLRPNLLIDISPTCMVKGNALPVLYANGLDVDIIF